MKKRKNVQVIFHERMNCELACIVCADKNILYVGDYGSGMTGIYQFSRSSAHGNLASDGRLIIVSTTDDK